MRPVTFIGRPAPALGLRAGNTVLVSIADRRRLAMRRYFSGIGLMLAATVLFIVPAAAPAGERPFRLSGNGALQFNPAETLSGSFAASGLATHLGPWENLGHIDFTPIGPQEMAASGSVRFVAANGDALDMDFAGVIDGSTGHGVGTFLITGGTGRFTDASGTLHMELQDLPDGTFTFTLDGTIDY